MKIRTDKNCIVCDSLYSCPKKTGNKQYSISSKIWDGRKYCSPKCASFVNSKLSADVRRGVRLSDTQKQKISIGNIGKHSKKRTPEQKERISKAHIGQKAWNKGKKFPERSGENHFRWIEDREKLSKYNDDNRDRRSSAYRYWRKQVHLRDKFVCKLKDKKCSGRLEVHHIIGYKENPQLRYEVNNGITLCHAHHPRMKAEEKRLIPTFQELVSVSK